MKTIYFMLSALFITSDVAANSKDSLEHVSAKKHEIGVIINPIGIILLGGAPSGQRIGVLYKHKLKPTQLYFTSGLYYQGINNRGFERKNEITLEVDGLLRNVQYNIETTNMAFASLGLEKRWFVNSCPQIITYLGTELILSYGTENTNTGNQWLKTDSVTIAEVGNQLLQPVSEFKQTLQVRKTNIGGGIQFNAGLQLYLNKRFYLFAQAAPSFIISTVTREEENFITNSAYKYKASQFDFDMRALVSDFGFVYKF